MKVDFHPSLELLIDRISEESGIPEYKVKNVITATFKFISNMFRDATKNKPDTFKSVRLLHIGIFRRNHKFFIARMKSLGESYDSTKID